MNIKKCPKCKTDKDVNYFDRCKRNNDGFQLWCKDCRKEYRSINKNKIKEYYARPSVKEAHKKYRARPKVKRHDKKYQKDYYLKNRQKILKFRKNYRKTHRKEINFYMYNKAKTDIRFKILCNLRTRIIHALKHNFKSKSTVKLLSCSVEFLKKYLESKFIVGMTWDNHGLYGWHIDHIIPCSSFDLSKPDEQRKCFHYTNLQPLWAKDNLSKSNRVGEI